MKKSTKVLIIVLLILVPATFLSFWIFDRKSVSMGIRKDFEFCQEIPREIIMEKPVLSDDKTYFKDVKIEAYNVDISVIPSDKPSYEISARNEEILKKNYNVKIQDEKLYIETKVKERIWHNNAFKKARNVQKNKIYIKIYLEDGANFDVDYVNGDFNSSSDLKKLNLNFVNGDVSLTGEDGYDMEIDGINGDLSLVFSNYDADFYINAISGNLDFLGDDIESDIMGAFIDYQKTIAKGKNKIDINFINSDISIK